MTLPWWLGLKILDFADFAGFYGYFRRCQKPVWKAGLKIRLWCLFFRVTFYGALENGFYESE